MREEQHDYHDIIQNEEIFLEAPKTCVAYTRLWRIKMRAKNFRKREVPSDEKLKSKIFSIKKNLPEKF